jgi:hypothetical protein
MIGSAYVNFISGTSTAIYTNSANSLQAVSTEVDLCFQLLAEGSCR